MKINLELKSVGTVVGTEHPQEESLFKYGTMISKCRPQNQEMGPGNVIWTLSCD